MPKKHNKNKLNKKKNILHEQKKETKSSVDKFDLSNLIISVISAVSSIILAIVSIYLTIKNDNFSKSMSSLNYKLIVYSPNTITYNELVEEKIIDGKKRNDGNIAYTASECVLVPLKDKISGEYLKVMFAVNYNSQFDIISFEKGQIESNYGFNNEGILIMTENSSDKISFYFSSTSVLLNKEFDILNVILLGYNGEFEIFSLIYSTKNFKSIVIDKNNLYTASMYAQYINDQKFTIKTEKLMEAVINEREELKLCLEN